MRVVTTRLKAAPTVDMTICPAGDPARLRREDCVFIRDLPAVARATPNRQKPSTLTVGGQTLEFFLEDAQSVTVRSWLSELWSRADARLVRDLTLILAVHIRKRLGLPEESLSALLLVPEEFHPTFSRSPLEVKTEGVEPCE